MNLQRFSVLLARHPHLVNYIRQEKFLLGYTLGSEQGQKFPVFLLNSPWRDYCLQATASESIPSGGVLVVTPEEPWTTHSLWQAYSWDESFENRKKSSQSVSLASLATEISLKSAESESYRSKRTYQPQYR